MVNLIIWVIVPLLAFGIMMFFFSWAGSVLARRRLARLLQQDEVVLRKAETIGRKLPRRFPLLTLLPVFWHGTLYLTDRRLIWRRYLFAYPGPSVRDIPLERVDEVSVQRLGWFGSLRIKAGDDLLIFHPYRHYLSRIRNREFAEDMAKAINEARAVLQGVSP